ncbi:MAG: CaiB/BaiF CoA transferase family protein, partial [Dehalococcoidia bacterium]
MGMLGRNKLSVCVDLQLPAGRELVKRLAAESDLLVENFSARVMPNFGLGYDVLREVNPGLIMLSMSGYGATGPYRDYLCYGSATESMTGMTTLLGYPGEEPLNSAIAYPDAVAGLSGAAAVLTALVYRQRTGRGQFLDLSQIEPATAMFGEYFLAHQMTGRRPARTGNQHPYWAPHGTYRCRGEDEWVSLAVRSDEEWAAFCAVAGLVDLGRDRRYTTAEGRRAHRERVDAAIGAWAAERDKFEAMDLLQRAGIPAGAVLNAKELVENPHLAHRGFFVDAQAPEGGSFPMPGTPITIDGRKRQTWHAAAYRGEHNRVVLQEVLGLSDAEVESLIDAGAIVEAARAVT